MSDSQQDKPSSGGKMQVLAQRSFSTVILLGLLAFVLIWNQEIGYYGIISLFCILTAWEWRFMLKRSGQPNQAQFVFFAGCLYSLVISVDCLLCHGGAFMHLPFMMLSAPVLVTIVAFIRELFRPVGEDGRAMKAVASTVLAFLYPGWLFAFAIPTIQLAFLSPYSSQKVIVFGQNDPFVIYWVLGVILVTKMSDIFAYVSGIICGGRFFSNKMIPHISPKKTWEGFIGSWLLTNLGGILLFIMIDTSWCWEAPLVFAIIGVNTLIFLLAVCGDLAGSLIKRSLDIKDSGSLLPGIGGLFDLIDSLSFTIPPLYFFLWWLR